MPIYVEKPQEYDVRQIPSDPDEQVDLLEWLNKYHVHESGFVRSLDGKGGTRTVLHATFRVGKGVEEIFLPVGTYLIFNLGDRTWWFLAPEEFEQNYTKVRD